MTQTLIWLLSLFFLIGTFTNGFGPLKVREGYARWGYPHWFRYVTAGLELVVAMLLLMAATVVWGALLGMAVMAAANLTLLHNRETLPSLGPATVFVLLAYVLWEVALPG